MGHFFKKLSVFNLLLVLVNLPAYSLAEGSQVKPPQPQTGYVVLEDKVPRYVEYQAPTQVDKPVVVLINGLVYDLSRWNQLKKELQGRGYGTLNYYIRGQFKTLRAEVEAFQNPLFFKSGLNTKELAKELKGILETLKLDRPVVVLGLSYGASVAADFITLYPEIVEQGIFMAPLVLPTDRYNPQGAWLYQNLEWMKLIWGPVWGAAFYDQAYNAIYRSYLEQRIIPERVPDEMKDIDRLYKEAIFHLVRATRTFDLRSYKFSELGKNKIHFILANEEDNRVFSDQVAAYDQINTGSRGALIYLTKASHAIPDSKPREAAMYLDLLLQQDSRIEFGQKYFADEEGLKLGLPRGK